VNKEVQDKVNDDYIKEIKKDENEEEIR